ncbi:MAG: hypothetical protein WA814_07515 [Candidatus Baltobacteraceae bacterium]
MREERRQLRPAERLVALLAAAVAIALNVAATVHLFAPPSTFGYHLTYTDGYHVTKVDPKTSAARAGIEVGDHVDFTGSKLHDRIIGLEYQPAYPGERVTFAVVRPGAPPRTVTLQASPLEPSESFEALFSPLASFLRLAAFAYIGVALIILLRRPSRMTWGLFLYLVSATNVSLYRFPDPIFLIAEFASTLLGVVGPIGLVIFAARFPHDRPTGWRALLDRLAIPIGVLFAIPNVLWDATALFWGWSPPTWMSLGSTLAALALILVAAATLAATYFGAPGWERHRLQWIIAGVLMTLGSYASAWASYWELTYAVATSNAFVWGATILYACAPFAIAYAVVRQRVFDISFVVSRTLVYTILTAAIFAFFALVEWVATKVIEGSGATIALVALAAIVVAFSLNALHSKVEGFVERVLFRRRHLAERHLEGVAAGLPYAENEQTIEEAIVREPVRAYSLSSAELFKRDGDGAYLRDGVRLDNAVSLRLQGSRRPVRLQELDAAGHSEFDPRGPALAVPVFANLALQAIAIYGAHVNGEDIDPDEAASIEKVCCAAGTAYEHLETLRIEREIASLRRLTERQSRMLAVLQAQKPDAESRSTHED